MFVMFRLASRTLLVCLCCVGCLASALSQDGQIPREWVNQLLEKGTHFSKHTLFVPSKKNVEEPAIQATFQLNYATLNSVWTKKQSNIELDLPLPSGDRFTLLLYRVNLYPNSFRLNVASKVPAEDPEEVTQGIYYHGTLKDHPGSFVALSVFENEVSGLISSPTLGNLSIARIGSISTSQYALYKEEDLHDQSTFNCFTTTENGRSSSTSVLEEGMHLRSAKSCISLYLEVDYDVYLDKGGLESTHQYIMGLFNQVAILYANERIKVNLASLFVWNTISPYQASSASGLFSQFIAKRAGQFSADAGLLIAYKGGGGIASVDALCATHNMGYAGINKSYNNLPVFSFSVLVFAHELGHILGSQHTHDCVWNGNNTAIDGCPGFTAGGCTVPEIPTAGGTIMSYCHVAPVRINFSLGFGAQPGNLIRNKIASATCISDCINLPPASNCSPVVLNLVLDAYGNETTWEIVDYNKSIVAKGGPYKKGVSNQKEEIDICLAPGCYTFKIMDAFGDGMCCLYGPGSFLLTNDQMDTIAQGGQFKKEMSFGFCVDDPGPTSPPSTDASCTEINFKKYTIESYGYSQDQGTYAIGANGSSITIRNNAWKAIPIDYDLTPNTILVLSFKADQLAEIQGIGLDDDLLLSSPFTFQFWGTQQWGHQDYHNYEATKGNWKYYQIPIGEKYTGKMKYLFFACDNDVSASGNAQFKNIRLYEKNKCVGLLNVFPENLEMLRVFPNPATQILNVELGSNIQGAFEIALFDILGRSVYSTQVDKTSELVLHSIPVAHLARGVYNCVIRGNGIQENRMLVIK